jgi:hypothetical protein
MMGGVNHRTRLVWGGALLSLAACDQNTADDLPTPDAGAEEVIIWFEEDVPLDTQYLAVWGRSHDDVWAVGWDESVLHFDGRRWSVEDVETTLTSTAPLPITSVHGTAIPDDAPIDDPDFDPGPVFAVGWEGLILQRDADGVWRDAPKAAGTATITEDLFGVFVFDAENAMAVGDTGTIWTWDGLEWSRPRFQVPGEFSGELIEPRGKLHAVWSGNGRAYFIVGSAGAAYRSRGDPTNFEAIDTRLSEPLRGVWGTANDDVYAVGLDTLVLRYTNQWRVDGDLDDAPTTFLFGIHGRGRNDFLVVGWRGVALRNDGEWRVEQTYTDADLRGVWMAPRVPAFPPEDEPDLPVLQLDRSFAVGTSGTILRRELPLPEDYSLAPPP